MTDLERILSRLNSIDRKIDKLSKREEYITAEEVKVRFNISKKTLQIYRRKELMKDYKSSESGRGFLYAVSELEKLFHKKMKVA